MAEIRATENEFRSQVISWLNAVLSDGGYPFSLVTGDPSVSTGSRPLFPDVQLWINREAERGFCGWELKTPQTLVDDTDLVDNAKEKAERMHARYFVTWNMRDAIIWEIGDQTKQPQRLFQYPPLPITSVEDLKVKSQSILLESRAKEILHDISRLYHDGHLTYVSADDYFFIRRITDTANSIYPFIKEQLLDLFSRDPSFQKELREWATKQGFYIAEHDIFFDTLARQIVYQLLGRLLFSEVLRQFRSDLQSINLHNLSEAEANKELRSRFAEIRAIDYQAIFEEDLPDKIPVPGKTLPALSELIDDLGRRDFAHLPQEVLGSVFENLIPSEERHHLGQYFTREDLVDFITSFCVRRGDAFILDPTCGTGTFLIRAYNRLKWHFAVHDHQKLLSQIWGVDIAPFPAELATINLYRQNISNIGNFPRILKDDFFLIREGQEYEFPPNKPLEDDPTRKIKEAFPGFDTIIGNPPYIRQEDIDRVSQNYSQNIVKPSLDVDRRLLAPDISKIEGQFDPIELTGQADIYASMFVHAAALLKEGGRLGFVTSNSWLGSAYGQELQKFFLRHFKIIAIVESRVEPWFETAQVNTIFTILERCENKKERDDHLIKFVSIKKKLKDLIPWDMQTDAMNRWHNLDMFVAKIENAGSEFIKITKDGISINPPKLINDFEDENFRIRVVKQESLGKEISLLFGEGHWGRFLRAPKVYFDLRETLRDKFVSLADESIATTNRGITGGVTEFFSVTKERAKEFGIEDEFLASFIASFREIEKPIIDSRNASLRLFVCHLDKNELRKLGKKGALKYIEWGEKQRTSGRGAVGRAGILWPEVPSVKSRPLWYDVGEREPGDVIINRFIGERIFFPVNPDKILVSDTFFEVHFLAEKLREFWVALMNSAITYLIAEVHGRVTWSVGVMYLYGPEIKTLLLPDVRKISSEYHSKILTTFEPLLKRSIKKISEEVKQKDRREFDEIVLESLGLDPKKYLDEIYSGLIDLVETRVKLGRMQNIQKKARTTRDIPKIKEDVIREVIPDGLRPFPESFVSSRAQYREIAVPTGHLRFGDYFLGRQNVVNERGDAVEVFENEAEFIIYAQKPNTHIVRIPKSEIEVKKALQQYRLYLKDLRERLMRALVIRTGDESNSETLTAETMEALGVLF